VKFRERRSRNFAKDNREISRNKLKISRNTKLILGAKFRIAKFRIHPIPANSETYLFRLIVSRTLSHCVDNSQQRQQHLLPVVNVNPTGGFLTHELMNPFLFTNKREPWYLVHSPSKLSSCQLPLTFTIPYIHITAQL
jgi:hypothetical protein